MLQRKTISPLLSEALNIIMHIEQVKDFRLAGGTAIALQIGHRRSLDIDMFSDKYDFEYNFDNIYRSLKKHLKNIMEVHLNDMNSTGIILKCNALDKNEYFKMDFWKWPNPFLFPPLIEEEIRMATLSDLAAMKFEAINDRSNYRDYVDIAFLSENFTFSEMAVLYKKRTLSSDFTRIITALSNPDNLVKDQKLFLLKKISEKQLREKVNYMLYVYTKEQEEKRKKGKS